MTRQSFTRMLWILVAFAAALMAILLVFRPEARMIGADNIGQGDYALVQDDGTAFTQATLTGAPSLVFFGYTHCPDVCPTTLADIATWQDLLGPDAEDLRIFFVSVDPERDAPDILSDYVGWLPGAHGVSGSRVETDSALRAFRVFAQRRDGEDGEYTMDHMASVLMFGADGSFRGTIPYQVAPEDAVAAIRPMLDS